MKIACLCLVMVPLACTQVEPPEPVASAQVEATRGPVAVTATMTPAEPAAGEHITLHLDVRAAAGVTGRCRHCQRQRYRRLL